MWKKRLAVLAVAAGAAVALSIPALSTAAKGKPAATGAKGDGRETCYGCHEEVKALKEGSKHARLACDSCHDKLKEHLANYETKPGTNLDPAKCGSCHKNEYSSFFTVNYDAQPRKEKGILRWCRFVRQPEGVFKQRPMVVGFTGFRQPFSRAVQQSKPGPGSAS